MRKHKMGYTRAEYRRAFDIACDLLNGSVLYGIDADFIFRFMMEKEGCVSAHSYQDFILKYLDRFSDNGTVREKAINRLGW